MFFFLFDRPIPPIVLIFLLLFTALLFLAESFAHSSEFSVHGVDFYTEQQNSDSREGSREEFSDELHRGVFVVRVSRSPSAVESG